MEASSKTHGQLAARMRNLIRLEAYQRAKRSAARGAAATAAKATQRAQGIPAQAGAAAPRRAPSASWHALRTMPRCLWTTWRSSAPVARTPKTLRP